MKPIVCGDSRTIPFTVIDQDGNLLPITGARIFMTVRSPDSHVVVITKDSAASFNQATVVNGPLGQGAVFLLPADSVSLQHGDYPFALKVILTSGAVYTVLSQEETIPFRRNKSAI